jgi:type II secretion system protein H
MAQMAQKAAKVITRTFTTIKNGFNRLTTTRAAQRKTASQSRKGFTLLEIMLVIMLIGLMAGIGAGFAVGTYRSLLVKKAARDFLLAAKFARITAIESQQICQVAIDRNENSFALVSQRYNQQTGQAEEVLIGNQFFKPTKLPSGVQFEEIQINNIGAPAAAEEGEAVLSILFYPDGTAQAAIMQIGDGRDHFTVNINPATGRARLFSGTAENAQTGVVDLNLVQ